MRIKSYIQSMSKSIYFRILRKKQEKDIEKLSSRLRSAALKGKREMERGRRGR